MPTRYLTIFAAFAANDNVVFQLNCVGGGWSFGQGLVEARRDEHWSQVSSGISLH